MKTEKPLILTARIAEPDLAVFDRLRAAHFPPDRNHLHAHITVFHRLPGEYGADIVDALCAIASPSPEIRADVSGLRHLGEGVAFTIASPDLQGLRESLRARFLPWLGSQDLRPWQPHVTVQNKASPQEADQVYRALNDGFEPYSILITGLDLWDYLGGPWRHAAHAPFRGGLQAAPAGGR